MRGHPAGLGVEERDVELRARTSPVVYALNPMAPSVLAAAGRTCSIDVVGLAPLPRDVLGLVERQLAERRLDRSRARSIVRSPADVGFGQVQHGHDRTSSQRCRHRDDGFSTLLVLRRLDRRDLLPRRQPLLQLGEPALDRLAAGGERHPHEPLRPERRRPARG